MLLLLAFATICAQSGPDAERLITFTPATWVADGGDAKWVERPEPTILETTADSIRLPQDPSKHAEWVSALNQLRANSLEFPSSVRVTYTGERAWVRVRTPLAQSLRLRTGEPLRIEFSARWLAGPAEVGFGFDIRDALSGSWKRWSSLLTSRQIPQDGEWHNVVLQASVPALRSGEYAVPIIGLDRDHSTKAASFEIRDLVLTVPSTGSRPKEISEANRGGKRLDLSLYDRKDLAWSTSNFACHFVFLYDRSFYDLKTRKYLVEEFLDDAERRLGGADSVVLWHAYPRIGVDERNQFDFYRDMPGGLKALRDVVRRFHKRGVKVFLNYNPWDIGTRRETSSDAVVLGEFSKALDVDGIFLDTMFESPSGLREELDKRKMGQVLQPEGSPSLVEMAECSASWAQWLAVLDEPSVMRLKWIEPRHMRHQVRRWDRDRLLQLETAWFNGSGMLIWENVFGSMNTWSERDAALWKRGVPILRAFAPELSSTSWVPGVPMLSPGTYASRWEGDGLALTLFVDRQPSSAPKPLFKVTPRNGLRVFDLWLGRELEVGSDGVANVATDRLGAIAECWTPDAIERISALVQTRPRLAGLGDAPAPLPIPKLSVHELATKPLDKAPDGMVAVSGGEVNMRITHEKRECGCYLDPGKEFDAYVYGGVKTFEPLTHDYVERVKPFFIDECLVTNAQFQSFLDATRYKPKDATNFIKHWGGTRCPDSIRDHPVVYVDLEDARAYAKWSGTRLPTEPEWQLAGQGTDVRTWPWGDTFDPALCNRKFGRTSPVRQYPLGRSPSGCYDMTGNVWQWTEGTYDDGHTQFTIIRGGSSFDAQGSGWYVHGGARPLDYHAKFILMGPSLDRCSTVGFRCVRDRTL